MKHIVRTTVTVSALAVGLSLTACVATGEVGVSARVDAPPPPTLAYVEPNVWVVAEHDRPIFYHDNWYWLYSDGVWLRSRVHTGSFVRVSSVPRAVVRIDRPRRYVRYKARPGVRVRRGPAPRSRSVRGRDDRGRAYRPAPAHRPPPGRTRGARPDRAHRPPERRTRDNRPDRRYRDDDDRSRARRDKRGNGKKPDRDKRDRDDRRRDY